MATEAPGCSAQAQPTCSPAAARQAGPSRRNPIATPRPVSESHCTQKKAEARGSRDPAANARRVRGPGPRGVPSMPYHVPRCGVSRSPWKDAQTRPSTMLFPTRLSDGLSARGGGDSSPQAGTEGPSGGFSLSAWQGGREDFEMEKSEACEPAPAWHGSRDSSRQRRESKGGLSGRRGRRAGRPRREERPRHSALRGPGREPSGRRHWEGAASQAGERPGARGPHSPMTPCPGRRDGRTVTTAAESRALEGPGSRAEALTLRTRLPLETRPLKRGPR